jgi:catechol 2,3-dioxygenase-like lactoylglutathione lyase family enzyme
MQQKIIEKDTDNSSQNSVLIVFSSSLILDCCFLTRLRDTTRGEAWLTSFDYHSCLDLFGDEINNEANNSMMIRFDDIIHQSRLRMLRDHPLIILQSLRHPGQSTSSPPALFSMMCRNNKIISSFLILLVTLQLSWWKCEGFFLSRPVPATFARSSSSSDMPAETPLFLHHTAIKTRNITLAIQFYSLLGFDVTTKFRAGPAKAAWLEHKGSKNSRLELIEVPSYMLNEPEGMKKRALDLAQLQDFLGINHMALDVSNSMREFGLSTLSEWIDALNIKSLETFGKTLRIALGPQQQIIDSSVYELAFIYDADGSLIELLRKGKDLPQQVDDGWEPWDD